MKRSVFRLLMSLGFILLCPIFLLAQSTNLVGEYWINGVKSNLTGSLTSITITDKSSVDSIIITGGDFVESEWDELSGFINLIKFEITEDITSVANIGLKEAEKFDCISTNNQATYYVFGTENNNKLSKLETFIAHKLKGIANQSFQNCKNLKYVSLPDLEILGGSTPWWSRFCANGANGSCFHGCTSLEEIYIPMVKYIPRFCFKGCEKLRKVTALKATSLGYGAFSMDTYPNPALEEIIVPMVDTISWHLFNKSFSLEKLYLGPKPPIMLGYSEPTIGTGTSKSTGRCFSGIIDTIRTPDDDGQTWTGISALVVPSDPSGNPLTGDALQAAKDNYSQDPNWGNDLWWGLQVEVPSTDVLTIKVNNKAPLTGKSLQDILAQAISLYPDINSYSDVESIEVLLGDFIIKDWYHLRDSCGQFSSLKTFIIRTLSNVPYALSGAPILPPTLEYFEGNLVKKIGSYAFQNCSNLKSLIIPNVFIISGFAFEGCLALEKLYLPNLGKVGQSAFSGCNKLDTLILGSTVPLYQNCIITPTGNATEKIMDYPNGADNPFPMSPIRNRYLYFTNNGTDLLLPSTPEYKVAKDNYKNNSGFGKINGKTWNGWIFFDEHTLTVNVTNGTIEKKSTALEGAISASTYTHSAMDSLAPVSLLPLEKAVVYISDTLWFKPTGGYALHPTRSISTTPKVTVTNGTFAMPGKQDVTVTLNFEQLFHIDGNPGGKLDTLKKVGGMVLPKDSIFADDIIPIADIVRPDTHYEVCSINIKNLDETHITRDAEGNITHIRMPNPGVSNIEVEVDFCSKYTVEVVYGENHGSGVTNTTYRLLPSETLTIPTDAASCYEKDTITVKRADNASDITLQVLGGANYDVVTMPATPVNMVVDVSYRKQEVTITYNVNDAAYGSINGPSSQTIECGGDGDEVEAVPSDPEKYRLASWSDGTDIASAKHRATSVNSPITITANFEPIYYTVTVNNAAGGTASANKTIELFKGDNVTLTLTPEAGYGLKDLTIEDANSNAVPHTPADIQRTGGTYEFTMPASDVTVTPVFAQLYSILPDPSKPSECVTYDGGNQVCPAANLFAGDPVDVSKIITLNTGYLVDKVEMCYNGSCHEVTLGDIFTMPAFDVEIKVTFVPQYGITLTYAEGYKDGAKSETIRLGPGKTHTFSVEPNECYDFEEVIMAPTGVSISENGFDRTITMPSSPENINVQVNYTKKQVILDFAVSPAEAGYIKINGAENYNETADCGTTSFTVEAVSNDDNRYIFKEWSDGSSQGATRTETDVKKNITATAVFTVKHKVTVNATGGSATGDGYYMDGETVTLSLSPAAGFGLRSLKVDGFEVSGLPRDADAHTFTMPAHDVAVEVLFEQLYGIYPDPAHPADTIDDGNGNKICPVDSLFAGDRVKLTDIVKLADGYTIKDVTISYYDGSNWIVVTNGTSPSLDDILSNVPPTIGDELIMPAYNLKFEATFKPGFNVFVTYSDGRSEAEAVAPGDSYNFTVVAANECDVLLDVTAHKQGDASVSVAVDGTGDTRWVTMPAVSPYNIVVSVSYKPKPLNITYNIVPDATAGSVTGDLQVNCGSDATATATPNSGYSFVKWTYTNGTETTDNPITLINVGSDTSITAVFERVYTVTVNATNATFTGDGSYFANSNVEVAITPIAGYGLKGITVVDANGDGVSYTTTTYQRIGTSTYTFTMPAANVTVTPVIEPLYGIYPDPANPQNSFTDEKGNTIHPVDTLFAGEHISLSKIIEPAPGYVIDDLKIYYHDGTSWVVVTESTSPSLSDILDNVPADINTELIMPATNLKFEATFKLGIIIDVYHIYNGITENKGQLTGNLSIPITIPVDNDGYHYISITAEKAADQTDVSSWIAYDEHKITMQEACNVNVYVTFEINTYTIEYFAAEGGSIEGQTQQTVQHGNSGTEVKAIADGGYRFVGWSDGVTTDKRTDVATANITYTAQFAVLYNITSVDRSVKPMVNQVIVKQAIEGEKVVLDVVVPDCNEYKGSITASAGTIIPGILGSTPDTLVMPAQDVDVSATFEPASGFSLTATVVNYYDGVPSGNNDGGTITGLPSGTVNCGEEFTLEIINIKEHHRFEGWYENGTLKSTKTQIKVTVNTDRNIEARVIEPVVQNTTVDTCGYYKWYGEEFTFTQNRKRVFDGNGAPDTVRTISVTIHPEYKDMTLFEDAIFCDSHTWGNKTYHAEGNYIDTLKTNIHGCDSIVTLRLSKSAPITYSFSESTCDPSFVWNGITYYENGVFEQSFVTANGCDSIVTLTLSVNDNTTIYHADSIVEVCTLPYVFPKDGKSYGEGVQQIAYEEGTTCKRRHVIKLLISKVNKFIKNETVVSCGPYTLKDGSIVTQSDVREVKYTTNEGCDSIVTYNITIRDGSTIDARIDTTTCFSSFTLNGQTYSSSNTYTQTLTDSHGCDSIIELNLTMQNPVHKPITAEDTIKAQAYDSYTWNGSTYISSGFASKEIVSPDGCEITTTILDLTILEAKPVYDTICVEQFPFTLNKFNMLCPQEGNYDAITDNQGVKEHHYMHLGLAKSVSTNFTAVICEGNNYTWNGQTYSEAGSYPKTFHSGCTDSTVTLNLVSNANYVNRKDVTTCDATYDWFDENGNPTTYNTPGTYTATLPSKSGCDSTVTINLTLNVPTVAITKDTVFCGSYAGPDRLLDKCHNDSIVYNYTIENIVPIDSTITVYRANIDAFHPIKIWGSEFTVGGVFNMDSTSSAGCVHPRKLTINVIEPKLGEVIDTVLCQGQSIAWHGEFLSATGNKQAWSVNLDTLHYINLVVLPNTEKGHWGFVCNNGGKYLFGDSAYAAGRYMHPVKYKTNGYQHCDSVRFNLNVMPSSNLVETEDAITCDNELPWVVDGQLYRTFHKDLWLQGKYPMDSLVWKGKSINGCDSTIILNLNFKDTVVQEFTEVACGNYYWHATKTTYNKSGDYWFVSSGCPADSMVLHLTVNEDDSYTHWEQATIREGESYSFMGEIYTETGRYQVLGKTPSGCDLTYMLVLNVISTVAYDSTIVICENQLPYAFDYSDQYKVYHDIITAAGPRKCTLRYDDVDTLMTFHFVIKSVYNKVEKASVCNGKDYTWTLPDRSIRIFSAADNYAGDYVWTDPASISGCESTITLELNSEGYGPITVPVFTCDPEFKSEEDKNGATHTITVSGLTYPITFTAQNGGCDSVVIYDLHLGTDDNTPYVTYDTSRICGTSYSWNSLTVQWPGYDYEEDLEHVTDLGCRQQIDSMHVIIGNVINNNISTIIEDVCGDDPYFWDVTGQTLDAEGTFSFKHTTKAGCDSTITLTLNRHFPVEHFYHLLVDSSYLYHYRGVRKGESEWFHASDTIIDVLGKGIDPSGACDTVLRVYLTVIDRNLISGIDDNAAEREMLLLHPNPTSGVFFVEAPQATEVMLFGISGQLRHRQALLPEGSTQIDVGHLPAGVYIVRAGNLAAKLVKL